MKIIAQCIATAGWGTDSIGEDDEGNIECYHRSYAGVDEVIINPGYWDQYESIMDYALYNDFSDMHGFNRFKLTVYEDGSKSVEDAPR